jgi:DNA-binding NarL/FixJ family response regulator
LATNIYQERNKIARELYESFAKELAEVSFKVDESIGLNSTNSDTRESLRKIRASLTEIIEKSRNLRDEKFEVSPREMDVLHHLASGLGVREISEELFISQATVKSHINNLYRKLGTKNKIETVNRARKLSLLPQ